MAVQNTPNISTLRTLSGSSSPSVLVEGYTNPGDGGGGLFWYNSADTTSSDNGATIIVGLAGSRFYRIWDNGAFNVLWSGADRTSASPSDSAFVRASAVSAVIYVPQGKYKLESNFVYNTGGEEGSFSLFGDGMEATVLYFPTNGGITVNATVFSTTHIRDLSITAGLVGSGIALQLNYSNASNQSNSFNDITNIRIRGDDGVASFFWVDGIKVNGLSNINFTNVSITSAANFSGAGNGMVLTGTSSGSIVYNINACIFDFLQNGLTYGDNIEGVTISNSNFTNCGVGIVIYEGATGLDQLTISGCQMATTSSNILALSTIGNVQISGNLLGFEGDPPSGSVVSGSFTNFTFIGNNVGGSSASGNTTTGISISSGATGCIVGNNFIFLGTGVQLGSSTSAFNVQSNVYNQVTTDVINNNGTNTIGGGSK